ncbi:hypothetical protein [Nitrosopumilus ureiphilus]|uniref:Uncharacterized protein n=1 Tax=Nitrosopumilus ureiphilus TaxID=1470067 RepID=A0A7D5RCX8_9ARCH|nr:hypothetical protein [Nitrosopumilus ureiphilus]QLH06043.1 hypothetical protein C5F50_02325 [Nitrosopumilus ureiphilus]
MGEIPERANKLNRAFLQIFTDGMNSIKPDDSSAQDFGTQVKAWNHAFAFNEKLKYYVNDRISNVISLAGQPKRSDEYQKDVDKLVKELNDQLNSSEFEEMMNIARPRLPTDDPNYNEKMKAWGGAFTFPQKLKDFGAELETLLVKHDGRIPIGIFYISVDSLIKNLENQN